jgi:hypothetical protein
MSVFAFVAKHVFDGFPHTDIPWIKVVQEYAQVQVTVVGFVLEADSMFIAVARTFNIVVLSLFQCFLQRVAPRLNYSDFFGATHV